MSVRAYRVVQIIMEESSFNLWQNRDFVNFLDSEMIFSEYLNNEGTGIVDVPLELLEKALNISKELSLDDVVVERIKADVEYARSNKDEYVSYYCF